MSLRFSSRVPKRGSRLGVISKAIFKGIKGLQEDVRLKQAGRGSGRQRGGRAASRRLNERVTGGRGTGSGRSPGLSCESAGWSRLPNPVSLFGICAESSAGEARSQCERRKLLMPSVPSQVRVSDRVICMLRLRFVLSQVRRKKLPRRHALNLGHPTLVQRQAVRDLVPCLDDFVLSQVPKCEGPGAPMASDWITKSHGHSTRPAPLQSFLPRHRA
jgi:hypothetical protein